MGGLDVDRLLEWAASRHRYACLVLLLLALTAALPGFTSLFPMDRDEPRFAQASKQMLETGDAVGIRFQGEARNKKPVGIYWLQAGAVAVGGALGVPEARTTIWLYRLPSLLGALAAVLLTYWTALALTTRRGAVLAGALMSGALLLVVEAHLAKTDAAVLATVVAAMGVLARAWTGRHRPAPLDVALCGMFWTAVGVGILIKGPITPMIPLFAAIVLSVRHRSLRWLAALRPLPGALWCLLLVLPWFVLIVKATGGAFLAESIGHDMAGKVAGAQESHGAPFGTYAAAFFATAWPLAPFVVLGAPAIWRDCWMDRVFFPLAWIVPAWLLFELVPTKLPHYVLPLYPALAILAGSALERLRSGGPVGAARLWLFGLALAVVPLILPIALVLAEGRVTSALEPTTVGLGALTVVVALFAGAGAIRSVRRRVASSAVAGALIAAFAVDAFVLGWVMNERHADLLALSPRLAHAARAAVTPACTAPAFATVGDREPSLVFLTDTTLLMTDAAGAAGFMAGGPCRVAFIAQAGETDFLADLPPDSGVRLASRVAGTNINGGKKLDIAVYVREDRAP